MHNGFCYQAENIYFWILFLRQEYIKLIDENKKLKKKIKNDKEIHIKKHLQKKLCDAEKKNKREYQN